SYAGKGSKAYHPALMLRIILCQLACGIRPPARWAHNCRFHDELKWLGFGICPSRSRLYHFHQRLGSQLDVWLQEILGSAIARGKAERRRDPEKIVIAPGDADATPGRDKFKVFRPLYNGQIGYDLDSELILVAGVFPQQNDTGTLPVLLTVFTTWAGHAPSDLLTDAAYATVIDATACVAAGVVLYAPYQANDSPGRDAPPAAAKKAKMLPKERFTWEPAQDLYVCPSGHAMPWESTKTERRVGEQSVVRHLYRCAGEHCQACPLRAACTPNPAAGRSVSRVEGVEVIEALRERMKTAEAKALYKRRRSTVERAYADLKVHRRLAR